MTDTAGRRATGSTRTKPAAAAPRSSLASLNSCDSALSSVIKREFSLILLLYIATLRILSLRAEPATRTSPSVRGELLPFLREASSPSVVSSFFLCSTVTAIPHRPWCPRRGASFTRAREGDWSIVRGTNQQHSQLTFGYLASILIPFHLI